MTYILPLGAAIGCAICNGVAAVLQKTSADKEHTAASLEFSLLWRLARDKPYLVGMVLDLVAGLLVLIAVHNLPLFLVQSVIASGIVITFMIERRSHKPVSYHLYLAISMVLLGLVFVAITASPDTAKPISHVIRWLVILTPLPIALIGAICSRLNGKVGATSIALMSGVAFGGTSIAGRILSFTPPFWHIIEDPLLYAFVAYGGLGLLLFSIGLQRTSATALNTIMTASQTLVPTLIGVLCFGDAARHGLWLLGIIGVIMTLVGTIIVGTVTHHMTEVH